MTPENNRVGQALDLAEFDKAFGNIDTTTGQMVSMGIDLMLYVRKLEDRIRHLEAEPAIGVREALAREARAEHFRDAACPEIMYTWEILPEYHRVRWFNFADRVLSLILSPTLPPTQPKENQT